MTTPLALYGIPNCDTVKKARNWLTEHHLEYTFHDFKKQGVDPALLRQWLNEVGSDKLINRQGTTWKKLDAATQANCETTEGAIAVMQANPSVIKRPVLTHAEKTVVGFKPEWYTFLLP